MSSHLCDCAAVYEGKWADQHSHACAIFKCGTCGSQAFVAPDGDQPTYCTECCPDHQYEYERYEGKRCVTCHAEPPHDYYDGIDAEMTE